MSRAATQLPPGRHGIPREQVLASQQERILRGMTDAVAENGYARATVADVIRRAGVSRETFYQQFSGKDDCFLAALDATAALLAGDLASAFGQAAEPLERVDAVLTAYLAALADEPAAARAFLVEVYAAGGPAIERRAAMLDRFVDLIAGFVGAEDAAARFRCEAFAGAVSSMVTMRVATGRHESLPELREPLLSLAEEMLS